MRSLQVAPRARVVGFVRTILSSFFRRARGRRALCVAVAFNFLLWPGPGLVTNHVLSFARQAINARVGFYSYEALFFRRLFSQTTSRSRHETMAD
ncbi:MAG: hypothetical protein WAV47_20465, partial [Blastocatellia bacterium]